MSFHTGFLRNRKGRKNVTKQARRAKPPLGFDTLEDRTMMSVVPPGTMITSIMPAASAVNVNPANNVVVTFSETMNAATITTSNIQLKDAGNQVVPATISYDALSKTAVLDPTPTLNQSAAYTITIKGGSSGVAGSGGDTMSPDSVTTFTTRALAPNPIIAENQLPGNPQSEWDIVGAGDDSIQGFATDISYNRSQT